VVFDAGRGAGGDLQHLLIRDANIIQIYKGTHQIQRFVMARQLLSYWSSIVGLLHRAFKAWPGMCHRRWVSRPSGRGDEKRAGD
jgi:hypothetical protein